MNPEKAHFFVPTYSLSEIYLFFVQRNFFIKFEFRCGRLKPNLTIFSISDELFMTRFYSFDVPICKPENFRSHITSHLVRVTLEGATCWICNDASISFGVIRPATSTKNQNLLMILSFIKFISDITIFISDSNSKLSQIFSNPTNQ